MKWKMKRFFKKQAVFLRNEKGLSLIEVIIASVIFAFALVAYGYMFALGQGMTNAGGDGRLALTYAQESMERLEARGFAWVEADLVNWSGPVSNQWTQTDNPTNFHQRDIFASYVADNNYQSVQPPTTN